MASSRIKIPSAITLLNAPTDIQQYWKCVSYILKQHRNCQVDVLQRMIHDIRIYYRAIMNNMDMYPEEIDTTTQSILLDLENRISSIQNGGADDTRKMSHVDNQIPHHTGTTDSLSKPACASDNNVHHNQQCSPKPDKSMNSVDRSKGLSSSADAPGNTEHIPDDAGAKPKHNHEYISTRTHDTMMAEKMNRIEELHLQLEHESREYLKLEQQMDGSNCSMYSQTSMSRGDHMHDGQYKTNIDNNHDLHQPMHERTAGDMHQPTSSRSAYVDNVYPPTSQQMHNLHPTTSEGRAYMSNLHQTTSQRSGNMNGLHQPISRRTYVDGWQPPMPVRTMYADDPPYSHHMSRGTVPSKDSYQPMSAGYTEGPQTRRPAYAGIQYPHMPGRTYNVPSQHNPPTGRSAFTDGAHREQQPAYRRDVCRDGVDMRQPTDVQQLAQAISGAIKINHLPLPELSIFDGRALDYVPWRTNFDLAVTKSGMAPREKLRYLKASTGPRVHKLIDGVDYLGSDEAFGCALQRMDDRYGDERHVVQEFRRKLSEFASFHEHDTVALQDYSDLLIQVEIAYNSLLGLRILDDSQQLSNLAKKLPPGIKRRWATHMFSLIKNGIHPIYRDFVAFVQGQSETWNDPSIAVLFDRDSKINKSRNMNTSSTAEKPTCIYCHKSNHTMAKCFKFARQSNINKQTFIRDNLLCYGCLESGHIRSKCNSKVTCTQCQGQHPQPIHGLFNAIKEQQMHNSNNNNEEHNTTEYTGNTESNTSRAGVHSIQSQSSAQDGYSRQDDQYDSGRNERQSNYHDHYSPLSTHTRTECTEPQQTSMSSNYRQQNDTQQSNVQQL